VRRLQLAFLLGLAILVVVSFLALGPTYFAASTGLVALLLALFNALLGKGRFVEALRSALQVRVPAMTMTAVVWILALCIGGYGFVKWQNGTAVAPFRVAYYELGGDALASFVKGEIDPRMEKALSGQPFIVSNAAYRYLATLPLSVTSRLAQPPPTSRVGDWDVPIKRELVSVFKGNADWKLSPSMIDALQAARHSKGSRRAYVGTAEFWRLAEAADLEPEPTLSNDFTNFFRGITRPNLPRSLITIVLEYYVCWRGWVAAAFAPRLSVMLVILENISAQPLVLDSVSVREIASEQIRSSRDDSRQLGATTSLSKRDWFPLRVLKPGEKLAITLRLLLNTEAPYPRKELDAGSLRRQLEGLNVVTLEPVKMEPAVMKAWGWTTEIQPGRLLRYAEQAAQPEQEHFVFGPSFDLESVKLAGVDFKVRKRNPESVVYSSRLPASSCPFIYVRNSRSDSWFRQGHILYGISRPELKSSDQLELQHFDGTALIREEEQEVAYIDEMYVREVNPEGEVRILSTSTPSLNKVDGKYLELRMGEGLEVQFPGFRPCHRCTYSIVASGYYLPNVEKTVPPSP